MAGTWKFGIVDPAHVRVGVTQWDQFNNETVGLAEALVREAIQNSADAEDGTAPVKIRFNLKTLNAEEAALLRNMLSPLKPHFDKCGLKISGETNREVRVLSIEDFNTVGLTGSFEILDKGNFDAFWRAVGESEKSGQKGGRWGLGKLVYPSASKARSFFGMTAREGDSGPSVMGQVVLNNHSIGENHFPAHGFWSAGRSKCGDKLYQPVTDADDIQQLRSLFGLKRQSQPGLSVMIPHLIDELSEEEILWNVIRNYCFAILAGRLDIEVGKIAVNAGSLQGIANSMDSKKFGAPLPFMIEISEALNSNAVISPIRPLVNDGFQPDHFLPENIVEMKRRYSSGDLIHVRTPVIFQPKAGAQEVGAIQVFVKAVPENEIPCSLFARGAITLPDERNFSGAAWGAVIAAEGCAAKFLGDAENPSHTRWSARSKKLNENWERPLYALRAIRRSLRSLYEIVGEQSEELHEDALIYFFSLAEKKETPSSKKERATKSELDLPPREQAIRIRPNQGGFSLSSGPGAKKWKLPQIIKIRIAYDTVGGDPFKRFSLFDFDLRKWKSYMFDALGGTIQVTRANVLYFTVEESHFSLTVNGFDIRRDLLVDARIAS